MTTEWYWDKEPRCPTCGIILGDPGLVELGYCSSECEREARDG